MYVRISVAPGWLVSRPVCSSQSLGRALAALQQRLCGYMASPASPASSDSSTHSICSKLWKCKNNVHAGLLQCRCARVLLAALSLAPVFDLLTDVDSCIVFFRQGWVISATISLIVIYRSWRFFLVYACMYWPKPTLKTLSVLYFPGCLLPFWDDVVSSRNKEDGAPPSADIEQSSAPQDLEANDATTVSPTAEHGDAAIFDFGYAKTIQSGMFEIMSRRHRFLRDPDLIECGFDYTRCPHFIDEWCKWSTTCTVAGFYAMYLFFALPCVRSLPSRSFWLSLRRSSDPGCCWPRR